MTGLRECNHIVGFDRGTFPQHGDVDRLVWASEKTDASEPFSYCPCCGVRLFRNTSFTIASAALTIEADAASISLRLA